MSVSELFHENSKQFRADFRMVERIIAVTTSAEIQRMMATANRRYPSAPRVALPAEVPPARLSFDQAVLRRRSVRDFTGAPIDMRELAKLLRWSNGVTAETDTPAGFTQAFRAAPSGGAIYPVELYVVAFAVEGIEQGVYHFNAVDDLLELTRRGSFLEELRSAAFADELTRSAAVLVLTGICLKSRLKYGERGYRFVLLEAGHVAQNVLLTATAIDLGAFAVGGFVDDEVDDVLGVDGLDEVSLYLIPIGRPVGAAELS